MPVTFEQLVIKSSLIQAAASLAAGVISNLPDNLPPDPEIANEATKAENLMGFRVAHIFYDGFVRALADDKSWVAPTMANVQGSSLIDAVVKSAPGLLSALPGGAPAIIAAVAPLIKDLLAQVNPSPGPVIGNPSPAPGADLPPVS
mgnify:CR=1 FL=1